MDSESRSDTSVTTPLLITSAERSELVKVCEICPEVSYIQLTVPDTAKRIWKIHFTIDSCDQGWCSNHRGSDPYAGSYTWFAVYVSKKALRHNAPTYQRFLHFNVRASARFKKHETSWSPDDDVGTAAWLAGLQKGDIIKLIPRAEYPGWVNNVREARMSIYYEADDGKYNELQVSNAGPQMLKYSPLDSSSHEIRILSLQPGPSDEPIRCILSHMSLRSMSQFKYSTLSYCWGESIHNCAISITYGDAEYSFPVTESVQSALQRLHHAENAYHIWIDTICIDQNNLEERAEQVALMAEIYAKAAQVHVWLGIGDSAEMLALKNIRDFFNSIEKICMGGPLCNCKNVTVHSLTLEKLEESTKNLESHETLDWVYQYHRNDFEEKHKEERRIGSSHYSGFSGDYCEIISNLFRNPWFRRVWVLQEVINSRSATIHAGPESLPWKELVYMDSVSGTYIIPHRLPMYLFPPAWISLGHRNNKILFPYTRKLSKLVNSKSAEQGILDVFLMAIGMDSSDQRDKIFALFSFGRETKELQSLPDSIRPDYGKPIESVFADFTRWWILENKSLYILSPAVHSQCGRSWVNMDFPLQESKPTPRTTWCVGTEGRTVWGMTTLAALAHAEKFNFRACGHTGLDVTPIEEDRKNEFTSMRLRLYGIRVATIADISYYPVNTRDILQSPFWDVYEEIFDPTRRHEHWKQGGRRDLGPLSYDARPLVKKVLGHLEVHLPDEGVYELADQVIDGEAIKFTDQEGDKLADKEAYEITVEEMYELTDEEAYEPSDEGSDELTDKEAHEPTFPCHGKCFFRASDNSVGLCPANARVGDAIVIFFGGKVPFLLRRADESDSTNGQGHFELVGEYYIEGKMYGEAICPPETQNREIFTLI